jgi:hypothetical protein
MNDEKINVKKIDLTIKNSSLIKKKSKSNYKQDDMNKDQNNVIYIGEVILI